MDDRQIFERLLEMISAHYQQRRQGEFLHYRSPEELQRLLGLERSGGERNWEEIFGWVQQYLTYAVKTDHPRFVNRMWVGANLPSIVGEMVTALSNASACTYESAPVSTLMERYMISEMLHLVGFVGGEGQMTTGSSNANMIAMMVARNLADPAVKERGLFTVPPLFALVGAEAHYSMDKAANTLGLGSRQLLKVAVDDEGAIRPEALQARLEEVVASGGRPFFVAATAGTTVRGGYDRLAPLIALRQRYGFWLHVDGAWGGSVVLCPELRQRYLPGLAQADSFTWDFHKMLGTALMCNILLINRCGGVLAQTLGGGDGSYLFRDEGIEGKEDFGPASLQCGRRVDSLKWFLDWKYYGRKGMAERVERSLALCAYAEEVVRRSPFLELTAPRTSFNVCFRFAGGSGDSNRLNLALRTALYREGQTLVGLAYLGELVTMRLLVLNPELTESDLDAFFSLIVAKGHEMKTSWAESGSGA
jgi:glutamate/tyrosine decarboxylase-like PLP-dependent enzyme